MFCGRYSGHGRKRVLLLFCRRLKQKAEAKKYLSDVSACGSKQVCLGLKTNARCGLDPVIRRALFERPFVDLPPFSARRMNWCSADSADLRRSNLNQRKRPRADLRRPPTMLQRGLSFRPFANRTIFPTLTIPAVGQSHRLQLKQIVYAIADGQHIYLLKEFSCPQQIMVFFPGTRDCRQGM